MANGTGAYATILSLSDASLTVTPEVLTAKASVVKSKISKMQSTFSEIKNAVERTESYWLGEAGDLYRKKYSDLEPDLEDIFKRLSEHVTDLNQMAGVYASTESEIQEIAESLPADVII